MDAEIERLREEIKQESQAKEMLVQSIADLEVTTSELSMELEDYEGDDGEEAWKERYNEQVEMNKNVEKQIAMLNEKMKELNKEIENSGSNLQGSDLDQLNEIDLKKLLKHCSKEKRELEGYRRDLEWQLDTEAKARYNMLEEIEEYKATANELNRLNDNKRQRVREVKPIVKQKKNDMRDIQAKFNVSSKIPSKNRYYGIPDNQRIIDPRKGPVKRTAAAGRLPKIDSRDGSSSVKSSPGPQESKSTVQPRGFSSAEYARTKHA